VDSLLWRYSLLPLAMATYNGILLSSLPSPAFTSASGFSDRRYRTIASTCPQNDASCKNLPAKSYYTSATAPCCGNTGSRITSSEPCGVHSSKPQYCTVQQALQLLLSSPFRSGSRPRPTGIPTNLAWFPVMWNNCFISSHMGANLALLACQLPDAILRASGLWT
jgi:hypothetical protein